MNASPSVKLQNRALLVVVKYKKVFQSKRPKQKPPQPARTKAPNFETFIRMKPTIRPTRKEQATTVHPTHYSVLEFKKLE